MLKSQRTIVSVANNEIVICLEEPTADLLEKFEGKIEPFITRQMEKIELRKQKFTQRFDKKIEEAKEKKDK
jgi:hypothetical protein